MIRVLLSKSTCLIMKFANRVIVSANRKCTWNSREIRTWKRVVLMGKRLKIIYIKILWGGKYNKYIIKFVLWDCFLDIFAVEAYTASWIEIYVPAILNLRLKPSKPIRLRGLKYSSKTCLAGLRSRSLYGFVDWNLKFLRKLLAAPCRSLYGFVDWNLKKSQERNLGIRRSLYGFVDWNSPRVRSYRDTA